MSPEARRGWLGQDCLALYFDQKIRLWKGLDVQGGACRKFAASKMGRVGSFNPA